MIQRSIFAGANQGASEPGEQGRSPATVVRFYPDFVSWMASAAPILHRGSSPEQIWWQADESKVRALAIPPGVNGGKRFLQYARAASCHSHDDRWSLLYAMLWRMGQGERHLLELSGDPQVARLHRYAKSVRRDTHKMKAFVRFRVLADVDALSRSRTENVGERISATQPSASNAATRYVAWFEPEHDIIEYVAPFFLRRFTNMRWSILTPRQCVHWEGSGELWFTAGVDKTAAPTSDEFEQLWRTYYKSIFNPARLKVQAMRSEMPQKYWKNLPEAHVIPRLIANADQKATQMAARRKERDVLHCGARPPRPEQQRQVELERAQGDALRQLRLKASDCQSCPLWQPATQTVFGEGSSDARLMIIGEQPGDCEDLAGRPFVGPAGKLLARALEDAGIDRSKTYLTNAVKHFRFQPRGKRRLHRRPTVENVHACMHWLRQELALIDPVVVVYLGVTAASTEFGASVRVHSLRGRLIRRDRRQHMVAYHPASILRLNNGKQADCLYRLLVDDLSRAYGAAA